MNEEQPHQLYKELFHKLLGRCQAMAPKNRFKLKAKIYLLNATIINLCQKAFTWATYQKTKGVIMLHVGLSADGYLPEFFDVRVRP